MTNTVYTIGHSVHSIQEFVGLLARHQITAVADVRSSPYSRFNPQFNRETLKSALDNAGIQYVFLGHELGGRSSDRGCYVRGQVCYELLAGAPPFQRGLDWVVQGVEEHHIALMCAEKDPLACHRAILVSRHLAARGLVVLHILANGALESQNDAVTRLLAELHLPDHDLFRSHDEIVDEAFHRRAEEIAYAEAAPTEKQEASGTK